MSTFIQMVFFQIRSIFLQSWCLFFSNKEHRWLFMLMTIRCQLLS